MVAEGDPPEIAACRNCGHGPLNTALRFCPACGQETRLQAPTLREFAQQFGGAYFSTEGALWRTLWLLLFKPGELTRQYLAGRRKHYVLPLRLYLTLSLVTLLLVRAAGGAGVVQVNGDVSEMRTEKGNLSIGLAGGSFGLRKGVFFCEGAPRWLCERARRRIDIDPSAMAAEVEIVKDRFMSNLGTSMFVLLPGFALWLKLVYFNRRMRYTEHLVFALHIHAFWFVALAFTLPDTVWLSVPAFTAVPLYTMLAMRRVYGGRRWVRALRALVVTALYGVTLVLVLAALGLWSFLA